MTGISSVSGSAVSLAVTSLVHQVSVSQKYWRWFFCLVLKKEEEHFLSLVSCFLSWDSETATKELQPERSCWLRGGEIDWTLSVRALHHEYQQSAPKIKVNSFTHSLCWHHQTFIHWQKIGDWQNCCLQKSEHKEFIPYYSFYYLYLVEFQNHKIRWTDLIDIAFLICSHLKMQNVFGTIEVST